MGSKLLFHQFQTEKPEEEIKKAMLMAFRSVGGTLQTTPTGLYILQGNNGVNYSFAADFESIVNLRKVKDDLYEIECVINWKMNTLSWICLIVGFFVFGILWIVPVLYLLINPDMPYQQAMHRTQSML